MMPFMIKLALPADVSPSALVLREMTECAFSRFEECSLSREKVPRQIIGPFLEELILAEIESEYNEYVAILT